MSAKTTPSTKASVATRRWATMSAAAEYAACSERHMRDLIAQGKLRAYRIGVRALRIDLNELDALMAG